MSPWAAVVTVVVALLGAGGLTGYFGVRLQNRTTRETNLMDQQQEDLVTVRAERDAAKREALLYRAAFDLARADQIAHNLSPTPYPKSLTGGNDD